MVSSWNGGICYLSPTNPGGGTAIDPGGPVVLIPKCGTVHTNTFMIPPVTADVVAGGKIGTNPNGSKNETGVPNLVLSAPSNIEPSKIPDHENTRLGHVETSKYGSTSIEEYRVEPAGPDPENTDHI